jgi:hypothetical protein
MTVAIFSRLSAIFFGAEGHYPADTFTRRDLSPHPCPSGQISLRSNIAPGKKPLVLPFFPAIFVYSNMYSTVQDMFAFISFSHSPSL